MNDKLIKNLISMALGLIGVSLIIYSLGWLPAIGVFVAMWGNNLMLDAQE